MTPAIGGATHFGPPSGGSMPARSWVTEEVRAVIERVVKASVYDGTYYGLRFPFNPNMVEVLKKRLDGRFFGCPGSPYDKMWCVEEETIRFRLESVQALVDSAGIKVKASDFVFWLGSSNRDRAAFTSRITVEILNVVGGGFVVRTSHVHLRTRQFLKQSGGQYLPKIRSWLFSAASSPDMLVAEMAPFCGIPSANFTIVPGRFTLESAGNYQSDPSFQIGGGQDPASGDAKGTSSQEEEASRGSGSLILLPEVAAYRGAMRPAAEIRKVIDRFPLFDFQKENAVFMATRPGAGNFSEQGTGKTMTSVAAMYALAPDKPKLVVCPVNLQGGWKRDILKLLPDAKVSTVDAVRGVDWTVIGNTQLDQILSWRDYFAVMTIDEAHAIKESSSLRTQQVMQMGGLVPISYVLTGTPIPNRELEIYSLLRLTRHPIGMSSVEDFKERFCGTPQKRALLRAAISEWFVRSMKADVLNLPPKIRHKPMLKASKALAAEYDAAAAKTGRSFITAVHEVFGMLERFKALWAVAAIRKLPKTEKAIVFTRYNDTVDLVSDALDDAGVGNIRVKVSGGTAKRSEYETQFWQDPDKRVYVGTLEGNGTGLNLQVANHTFVLMLPWTAAALMQGEDRTHRIGQERAVNIYAPMVEGTIDEELDRLIEHKARISDSVIGAESDEEEAAEAEANQKAIADALRQGRKARRH